MNQNLYKKWLNIPEKYNPPNYYQLIGVRNFETDIDLIMKASLRRVANLKKLDPNFRENEEISKLMVEISRARVVLRDDERKKEYDDKLRAQGITEKDDVVISLDKPPESELPISDDMPKPQLSSPLAPELDAVGNSIENVTHGQTEEPSRLIMRDEPEPRAFIESEAASKPSPPSIADAKPDLLGTIESINDQANEAFHRGDLHEMQSHIQQLRAHTRDSGSAEARRAQECMQGLFDACMLEAQKAMQNRDYQTSNRYVAGALEIFPQNYAAQSLHDEIQTLATKSIPKTPPQWFWRKLNSNQIMLIGGACATLLIILCVLILVSSYKPKEIKQAQAKLAEFQQSLAAQDYANAERQLKEAKALLENHPDNHLLAELESAQAQLNQTKVEAPAQRLYEEAETLNRQEKYPQAVMKLEEIRLRYPTSSLVAKAENLIKEIKAKMLFDEGLAAENAEQYDKAKEKFQKLMRLYPNSSYALKAAEQITQVKASAEELDEGAQYMWDAAMKYKKRENYDKAIEVLKKLKDIFSDSKLAAQAEQEIATLEKTKHEKYEEAARELYDKAQQSRDNKRFDEAIKQFQVILKQFPDSKLKDQCQQAIEQTKTEKYESEAQKIFDEAKTLLDNKKYVEAANRFDSVIKKYPNSKLKEQAQAQADKARNARETTYQNLLQKIEVAAEHEDFSQALRNAIQLRGLETAQSGEKALSKYYEILSRIVKGIDGTAVTNSTLPSRVKSLRDEMVMVPVLAGAFTMGTDEGDEDAKPKRQVELDAFYIDIHEVTNAQYKRFLDWIIKSHHDRRYCHESEPLGWSHLPRGTNSSYSWTADNNYPKGRGEYAVTYVSWYDAYAYATWAGKSLPTEAQWEKAARGTKENNKYPWGEYMDPGRCACTMARGKTVVIYFPKEAGYYKKGSSQYGCLDMAGNMKEWCMDWYDKTYYGRGENQNPHGPASGDRRVLRGGCWQDVDVSTWNRESNLPDDRSLGTGFRCVINILN